MTRTPDQTILQMFDHLDERRYDALLALLSADAVWFRQGQRLQGREQIKDALLQRSPTMRVRHLVTNLLCLRDTGERREYSHYMLALRADGGGAAGSPARISAPFNMSLVTTTLQRDGEGWVVAEQAIVTQFEFAS
ncbi:nuclear transport factor 2 family protein [Piscinibacter sakaiensis]|uniref:nuclear transport factor 2 family protein n=1 Tax=Piscinibacter sakaiensis TaxID=1547922 RepID=UPI003AACCFAE